MALNRDIKVRMTAAVLGILTVAAAVFAWLNYQQETQFAIPNDGVWWVEHSGHLKAERVHSQGPGERAGVKLGDILYQINGQKTATIADLVRQLYRKGIYTESTYSIVRNGVAIEIKVIPERNDTSLINNSLRGIALIYLVIGVFVLLRRWTAQKSAHFYIFCLVSFIFYSFKYTGKFNAFDWTIYWSNVVATLLQPALFFHFALTFPEKKDWVRRYPWIEYAVYLPGALLLGWHLFAFRALEATGLLLFNLDRLEYSYLAMYFALAAGVLWHSYVKADTPLLRQQMKWVTRGTILSIVPFTLFYVLPTVSGNLPSASMKLSVLSLIFLPLTFGYAIVRYRLMDVDIIFKRGMIYTLSAAAIVGLYYGTVSLIVLALGARFPLGNWGLIAAVMVTALLFDPIKHAIQDRLDRVFDRKRYDYRRTLLDFGKELSSETDLDAMLTSVVDRLSRTLLVDRVAVVMASQDTPERLFLAKSFGITYTGDLDFSFLSSPRMESETGHLFLDNTRQALRESPTAQVTIAQLDLNYYIPCRIQNRTIAVLGLGKTYQGDFLSSEDVELLETLAGYLGIAIQNALLYASLEQKVMEYERLKDFNENIVESINVGVLAVDLEDRIESWNAQMEVMYAMPRAEVKGKNLADICPPDFITAYNRVRGSSGVHTLYKFRFPTPSGEMRVANIAIAPLVTRNFQTIGRLIIVDDITERIALESQVAQAEKLSSIGVLAAGVAHEVNTPLAVISSYAQMLAKQLTGDEKRSALLEKITQQTFRASEIVNNLLNFSRTGSTEFGDVDLNKVIADTLALLEHQLRGARIKVEHTLDPALPVILGNSGKLQQVFLNLLLNAKDAMTEGGSLNIVTANGPYVSVRVSDSGVGIAPEHQARIFDPFFTTKMGTKEGNRRGTGLGLAVTYGIIQEHAGKISVDSQPGEGTTFWLEFPVPRNRQKAAAPVAAKASAD
ncbi:MAG: PAS domain S-box protein [Acidobacteriales bacterium]|nr:PAS domain S-box protein [Terriglobales bacterium]